MAEEIVVGTLGVNARMNVGEFERETAQEMKRVSERIGREAGEAMSEGMARGSSRSRDFVERQMGMFRKQMDESRKAAEPVADAVQNIGKKSSEATGGVEKVSRSLAGAAAAAARVHPAFGRVADVFRSMAAGGVTSLAIIGGLTAITWAWDKLTEAKVRAKEQLESYVAAARRYRLERETQGDIGLIEQKSPLEAQRDQIAAEIRQLERDIADPSVAQRRVLRRIGQDNVPDRMFETMVEQETQAMRAELAKRRELMEQYTKDIDATAEGLAERRTDREEREAAERERERKARIAADKAMYGEARTLLEQWTESQMTELEKRIALFQRFEAAATLLGKSGAAAEIRRQREELEKQLKAVNDLAALRPSGRLGAGHTGPISVGRPVVPGAAAETSRIQAALQHQIDLLQVAHARGEITRQQMEEGITAAADAAAAKILTLLELYESLGLVSADVTAAIAAAFRKTNAETEEGTLTLGDYAAAFEGVARGVLGAADAMGIMSDESRRLVTGLLDVASALQQIDKAKSATDSFAKTLGMIGGVGAIIGGALQVGSALFGESPEDRERKDILRRNTVALEDLALELSGFRITPDVLQQFLGAEVTGTVRRLNGTPIGVNTNIAGFSNAELRELERQLGIQLFDSSGRLIPGAIEQAREAIRQRQANGGLTAGAGIAPQDRLSVSMTVVQGNQIVSVLTSINDHVRALRTALVGSEGVSLPASSVTAMGGPGGVSIETVLVQVHLSNPGDPYSVGREVGRGVSDELGAAWRASGRLGRMNNVYRES